MTTDITPAQMCKPLRLVTLLSDIDCSPPRRYHRFSFEDSSGQTVTVDLPSEKVLDRREAVRLLTAVGLPVTDIKEREVEITQALAVDSPDMIEFTRVSGWQEGVYVGHRRTFGNRSGKPPLLLRSEGADSHILAASAGSAAAWRKGLRNACLRSDYMTFAVSLDFAAVLMGLVGTIEGRIFYFQGRTTTGKSSCARVCQSAFGRAGESDLSTFEATPRALEEFWASRTDLVSVLDELGRLEGDATAIEKTLKLMSYQGASGTGKSRSLSVTATNQALRHLRWRTIGLWTAEDEIPYRAGGQKVRLITIKVPDEAANGIFNRLKEGEQAAAIIARVADTISQNYGVTIDEYIEKVVHRQDEIRREAIRLREHFVELMAPSSSADRRIVSKFGLVYAGAIIGCRLGATPWKKEHTGGNAVRLLCTQVLGSGFDASSAVQELIRDLKLERKAGRLPEVAKGKRLPEGADAHLGFRRAVPAHGKCIVLSPDKLKARWRNDLEFKAVIAELKRRDVLVTAKNAKAHTLQLQVKGVDTRPRFVVLRADRIFRKRKPLTTSR